MLVWRYVGSTEFLFKINYCKIRSYAYDFTHSVDLALNMLVKRFAMQISCQKNCRNKIAALKCSAD